LNGALLTRGTIWLALICYALVVVLQSSKGSRGRTASRLLWILGCLFFLAHVLAAFHFYHGWSHAAAAHDTQRQTFERLGVSFSAGIYFNYLFALVWLIDVVAGGAGGKFLHERNVFWFLLLHGFFLFMIFNATVVFGQGWARPAGVILCLLVIAALWCSRRARH